MRRRDFMVLLGGAVTWPISVRAKQQPDHMRRIGVLLNLSQYNPEGHTRLTAFVKRLHELGWVEGGNIRIDYRWSEGDTERTRKYAAELVALAPDVILAGNTSAVGPLKHETRIVPIVFAGVVDPIADGFVDSLARPGGNATGFTQFESGMSGKWIELLKEIMPGVTRVGVLRDITLAFGAGELAAIQAVAAFLGVEVIPIGLRDANEI